MMGGGVRQPLKYTVYSTHRTMSAGATLLVFVVVVVLLVHVSQASSHYNDICPTHKNEIKLFPFDTIYFGSNSSSVSVRVYAANCVNEKRFLELQEFMETNETSENDEIEDMKWYEFNYCGNYVARVGSIPMTKFKHASSSSSESECRDKPITIRMRPTNNVVLARVCSEGAQDRETKTKIACLELLKDVIGTDTQEDEEEEEALKTHSATMNSDSTSIFKLLDELSSDTNSSSDHIKQLNPLVGNHGKSVFSDRIPEIFDSLRNVESKSPLLESMGWPKKYEDLLDSVTATIPSYDNDNNNNNNNYFEGGSSLSKSNRHYKENAIPIFIGIVVFSVSMCLRFCLCRAKSVVRRVTTVTVIRSVGGGDGTQDHQQDPPPSYIDVVSSNQTSPQEEGDSEPPPPAYADIIDEVNLPTYSEVEAQNMVPREEVIQLSEQQDTQEGTNGTRDQQDSAPPDGKGTPPSPPTKNAITKYRSQQKQFSFKVLDEDE